MTFHLLMPLDVLVTVCTAHHRDLRVALRDLAQLPAIAVALVALAAAGCTTHHRFTAGPTYAVAKPGEPAPQPGDPPSSPPSDVGADLLGEVSGGGDELRLSLAGTARVGHGVTGGGFRAGLTLGTAPKPVGVRGSFSIGPTFVSDGTLLDVRAGLGIDYGFITDHEHEETKRTTVGAELFVSSIGTGDDHRLMIGIGISVGAYHWDSLAMAASRPAE